MAIVNLTQAAELAGIGRSTLWRKSKQGVLSTTKFPDGSPGIDTAELFRVFPRESDIKAQVIHEETTLELLKQEVNHLKEIIVAKDQVIEVQAAALRMLEHKTPPTAPADVAIVPDAPVEDLATEPAVIANTITTVPAESPPVPKRSLWSRLMGRA